MRRLSRAGLGAALGVAVAAAAVACSSFSNDTPAPIDEPEAAADGPGSDTDVADAAPSADGPLGATPGTTECPGSNSTCTTIDNAKCCFHVDSGTANCQADCTFLADLYIGCDDRTDCQPGQVCCITLGSTSCTSTAKCEADQLCRTNDECPVGESCVVADCRGRQIGTCGRPTNYLAGFCANDAGHD